MREYFCAYHSMLGGTRKLSDAECGRLFRALLRYSSGEDVELINLQGREEVLFDVYSQQIDRDVAAYEDKCAKNKANASGGKRTHANASDGTQDKDKDKGEDKDEGKDKEDTTVTSLPPSLKKRINDNYKHSSKARLAVAQELVNQFIEENLPVTIGHAFLYNDILDALEEGLTAEQVYAAGRRSLRPGDLNAILFEMNGCKWKTESSRREL